MAKLNVKVLDMQNGEITKVAYEGAEYAKVESNALIGDLALCVNETPFFTVGEFYLAWDLYENGEPRMKDDADNNYRMRQGTYVLFRKISAQSKPTLEQRVEAVESDVATLKGEKKSEETIEFEGATYRKVDREAREGDVVIIRVDTSSLVPKDTPFKVTGGEGKSAAIGDLAWVYSIRKDRTRETIDVYEPIVQAKYVPQEGDIVVVESLNKFASRGARVKVGDIGKVGEEGDEGAGVRVLVPGGSTVANYVDKTEIRKATPAEVEKYEQAVKDAEIAEKWAKIGRNVGELRKGDIVRITVTCGAPLRDGELIEVISNSIEMSALVKGEWAVCSKLIAPVESLF